MTPHTPLDPLGASPAASPSAGTMRAVVQDRYGADPEDVLRIEQVDRPTIGDGEVLVRVHAAGLDRGTWHIMAGLPYPIRFAGYGLRAPKNRVRGREVAGVVEQAGAGVTRLRVGDEVFGIGEGCFADYAAAREDKLARKPANLSFEQAAATTISALTALQAVRDRGRVEAGQQVLIIGASGGVGTFAVQIAKAFGADVTGMASTAKMAMVRALGADHVVDYTVADIEAHQRYDVVIDTGGHRPLRRLRRVLTPRGVLVIVGSETGGRWLGGFDRSLRAVLLSLFVRQTLAALTNSENAADLTTLAGLTVAGRLAPAIDRSYPLEDSVAAIRRMLDGHASGKLVIRVLPDGEGIPAAGKPQ
jgi:NADPH:quinone reductase-like Zn-dependent oxidoreductase